MIRGVFVVVTDDNGSLQVTKKSWEEVISRTRAKRDYTVVPHHKWAEGEWEINRCGRVEAIDPPKEGELWLCEIRVMTSFKRCVVHPIRNIPYVIEDGKVKTDAVL